MSITRQASSAGAEEVLDFWFADAPESPDALARRNRVWFRGGESFDSECAERFNDTLAAAARGELDAWKSTPRGRLALIILLDQFSRNIHRGTAAAFAQDDRALSLCKEGLELGHDRELAPCERTFFYMPLEHAEDPDVQRLSVHLFERLAEEAPEKWQALLLDNAGHAREHRLIVERFGRFPHRNAVLGRTSTDEEEAYLAGDAPRFGQ